MLSFKTDTKVCKAIFNCENKDKKFKVRNILTNEFKVFTPFLSISLTVNSISEHKVISSKSY